jgi:U6 snRNA-associated Sm-like protein LSm5
VIVFMLIRGRSLVLYFIPSIRRIQMTNVLPLALIDKCINAKVWIIMRGNTEFTGILKGYDDFVNLVLEDVTEYTYDEEGERHSTNISSSILLNGNAVTFIVPGSGPEDAE